MKKLVLLAGIAATSLTLTPLEASAQSTIDSRFHFRSSIVGTWQVEVTIRQNGPDCSITNPVSFGINPFTGLHTYNAGGTMTETGSRSPPSRRSAGFGIWKRTGGNSYDARWTFQGYDEVGLLVNSLDFRSDIDLASDGRSFTSVSRLLVQPVNGESVEFCVTSEGLRFSL